MSNKKQLVDCKFFTTDPLSCRKKQTTIADVPPDALDEIFIHLPIPDLWASRLVSRRWNSRIKDKDFIERVRLHYTTHAKVCMHDLFSRGDVMVLNINDEHDFSTETYVGALLPDEHPVKPVGAPYILGSVHDKVLFGNHQHSTLFIVDPGRRTRIEIADCQIQPGDLCACGLVYNDVKKRYYIVKVAQRTPDDADDAVEFQTEAFIFSLGKGRWKTKRLRNCDNLRLSLSVGTLNGKFYIWNRTDLVIFTHKMKEFRLLPVPVELRGQQLQFGVARERLRQGQVMDVLLVSCYNRDTRLTSLWRLRKVDDVDTFERLAVWNGFHGGFQEELKPISYMHGDPNKIILLVNSCSIQVYNLADQSRTEIFRKGGENWTQSGFITAIGFL